VVLASSVHCALREAIRAARKDFSYNTESGTSPLIFQLNVPAPMTVVKELCGFDIVEKYLENLSGMNQQVEHNVRLSTPAYVHALCASLQTKL